MTPAPRPPRQPEGHAATAGHIPEDRLVDLTLTDEPGQQEQEHLAACGDCTDALESLLRAVAGTRDAATTDLVDPPPGVWARIEAELDDDRVAADRVEAGPEAGPADARLGAVVPLRRRGDRASTASRRGPSLGWLAAACAAGVLLGAGGFLAADRLQGADADSGRTVATAELDTLDTGQRLGAATVSERGDGVVLDVTASSLDAGADGYVEVWLINRDGKRLVSVGVLGEGAESGTFPISQRLLDEGYVVVDISREQFDDKPQHSGDSIVRGSLTTPA